MANFQLAAQQLFYLDCDELAAWQQQNRSYTIVDTRPAEQYVNGSLPHAMHLPASHARSSGGRSPEDDVTVQQLVQRSQSDDLVFIAQTCTDGPGSLPDRKSDSAPVFTLDLLFYLGSCRLRPNACQCHSQRCLQGITMHYVIPQCVSGRHAH